MAVKFRTRATAVMLSAALLHGTIAPAAADWPYFRLKSSTGQVTGNDGPPHPPVQGQFSFFLSGPSTGTVGQSYAATPQVAGATGTVSFALSSGSLPPGVVLDPASGAVSGVPQQAGEFSAIIGAVDVGTGTSALASISIRVATAFGIVGVPSGIATVGELYSVQFQGTGGAAPYSYWTSSVLPPGLSLGTTGAVAGVPNRAGTYPAISISARDADGRIANSSSFTVVVSNPLAVSWAAASGRVGDNYSSVPSTTGGHAPLFYVLNGALPGGLSFSSSSGAITGIPTTVGNFQVQIAVGDQDGRSAQTEFQTISVVPAHVEPPLAISGSPATSGQVDVAYSASFSAAGGSGDGYAYDLVGAPLPDGLTLTPNGVISGSPTTAATYAGIQIRVTDSEAHTALSNVFSIIVAPAPLLQLSGNPSAAAQVGVVYSANFVAFDGSGAGYTFTSIGAPLPPGLSLSKVSQAQANIAGTPTYVGTYSGLQVRVTDSANHTSDSSVFAITVAAPAGPVLAVSGSPATFATVGATYSAKISATGGSGSGYVFALASGSLLPVGLTIDPSGLISGTPSTPQTSTFTLVATDSAGDVGHATFTVTVSAPLAFSGTPAGTSQGAGYLFDLASITSGGRAPYSYVLDSGVLPAGMMLDGTFVSSAGISGSTSAVVIRATDADGRTASASLTFIVNPATATASPGTLVLVGETGTVRAGRPISGGLSTNIPNPTWTFAQTPAAPAISFASVDGRTFSAVAPGVSGPTNVTVTATATNGAATQSATSFTVQLLPQLVVSDTGQGSLTGVVGAPFSYGPFAYSGVVGTPILQPHDLQYADGTMGGPTNVAAACPGLSVDSATGAISGIPTAACTVDIRMMLTDSYDGSFVVHGSEASWPNHLDGSGAVYRWIADPAPTISIVGATASVALTAPNSVRSNAVVAGTLSSNIPSPTWAFSSAPSGLSLAASGSTFSGAAPSVASRTDYLVTATATSGASSASGQFSVSVAPPLAVAMNPVSGTVGNPTSGTPSVSGVAGAATYALIKAGNLYSALATDCPGLSFSTSTGAISGTPTANCSVAGLAVRVSDDFDAATATSETFGISATTANATAALATAAEVRAGSAIAGTLSTNLASATWSFSQTPTSPSLGLSGSGSAFAGTAPSVSSKTVYAVTATATAGSNHVGATPFSVTVDPALAVSGGPAGTVSGIVGNAIAATASPSPSGAIGTISYALLQSGSAYSSLSADCGLSFSVSSGVISGTPSQSCSVPNLTIKATDSFDGAIASTSATFAISIGANAATASLTSSSEMRAGAAIAGTLSTNLSGATWSLVSVPAGLTLTSSGSTFSGTAPGPSSQTVYTVTATATSGSYSVVAPSFTVTVNPTFTASGGAFSGSTSFVVGNPVSTAVVAASGVVGSVYADIYNQWVSQSGGPGVPSGSPVDLSAVCPGLSFNHSTGAITGTPSAGCFIDNLRMVVSDTRDNAYVAIGSSVLSYTVRVGGSTATSARTSAAEVRAGASIAGTLSTNLNGASWSFVSAPSGLALTASGSSFSGIAPSVLSQKTYSVTATATSGSYHADAAAFSVTVDPTLAISGGPSGTVAAITGSAMTPTSAPSATGVVETATYGLLQSGSPYAGLTSACGLTFSSATGQISGTPTQACSVNNLTISVTDSRDGASVATSAAFSVAVTAGVAVSGTPAAGAVSEVYSFSPTVSGGSGTYTSYAIANTSGSLSALGLSFSTSTGAITGTPTTAGTWQGTISATDSFGNVGTSSSLAVTVNAALAITPSTTAASTAVGETWSGVSVTTSGGAGTKTFSVANTTGTLSALGLSFSTTTGAITGSPTTAGSWTGTIKVVDPGNSTGVQTASIAITVNAALAITPSATSSTTAINETWSGITVITTGGAGTKTYSTVNTTGTLAALGLSINTSTGAIAGTPTTAGSWTGTIKVVDPGNSTGVQTASITVTVNAAIAVASAWPSACTASTQCSAVFTATGGVTSTYAWTVPSTEGGYATSTTGCTSGSASCTVKWTPTTAGTLSTTAIQVSDGGASVSSTTTSITVNAAVATSQTFDYTGSNQTFTVPAGVTSINVKMWGGAGGGNGGTGATNNYPGGAGGYAEGLIAVTPGQTLTVQVGGGGHGDCSNCLSPGNVGGWPGGGTSTFASSITGGAGGGYSGIFSGTPAQATALIIAGAGGGGGAANSALSLEGGAGGGATGVKCSDSSCGSGGTQAAGGAAGPGSFMAGNAGSALTGASDSSVGGAGGGGYWGGGSGGHDATGGAHQGGGGGGSGYVGGAGVTATANTAGSGTTPPKTNDAAYSAGIAVGGAAKANGGNGRVYISWTSYTLRAPAAVNTTFTYAGGSAAQANLYDGNDGTSAADPSGVNAGTMAAYDLGAAFDIARVRLITAAANGFASDTVFTIQYSDAGLSGPWTSAGQNITANAGTARISTAPVAAGAHRFWRIAYSSGTTLVNAWLGELGFYTSP